MNSDPLDDEPNDYHFHVCSACAKRQDQPARYAMWGHSTRLVSAKPDGGKQAHRCKTCGVAQSIGFTTFRAAHDYAKRIKDLAHVE